MSPPQGYGYESYTCPDCGSSLYWPGLPCSECRGEGKPDVRPAQQENLPIQPQPWQEQSRAWKKEDEKNHLYAEAERLRESQAKKAEAKKQEKQYERYRKQYHTYKKLAITVSTGQVELVIRAAVNAGFRVVQRESIKTSEERLYKVIVSDGGEVKQIGTELFDLGWRPVRTRSSVYDTVNCAPLQAQEPVLDSEDVLIWNTYLQNEQLDDAPFQNLPKNVEPVSNTASNELREKSSLAEEKVNRKAEAEKWKTVRLEDKKTWKDLLKDID